MAEAQQTLVLNDLRSRVRLQTDGQLKNGERRKGAPIVIQCIEKFCCMLENVGAEGGNCFLSFVGVYFTVLDNALGYDMYRSGGKLAGLARESGPNVFVG